MAETKSYVPNKRDMEATILHMKANEFNYYASGD